MPSTTSEAERLCCRTALPRLYARASAELLWLSATGPSERLTRAQLQLAAGISSKRSEQLANRREIAPPPPLLLLSRLGCTPAGRRVSSRPREGQFLGLAQDAPPSWFLGPYYQGPPRPATATRTAPRPGPRYPTKMALESYYQGLKGQLLAERARPNASTTSEAERRCSRTALPAAIRKGLSPSRASVALSHGAKRAPAQACAPASGWYQF